MVAVALPGLRRVEHVMGMPIVVDIRDDDVAAGALDEVFDWFRAVDATLQHLQGRERDLPAQPGELALADAHPDVRACSRAARSCARRRADISTLARPPRGVDPSGLVKGWSVDRAAALLDGAGAAQLRGQRGRRHAPARPRPARACWRVGIQHPHAPTGSPRSSIANDLAVATSGAYERGEHVVDPHTRRAAAGVLSVTITGPELATADAYATAAFAMGEDGPGLDGAAARLRGDDDPRRRARALDAELPG